MAGGRFTAWLDEEERAELDRLAREYRMSANFVLRLHLRASLFNEPLPSWLTKGEETRAKASR